LYVFFIFFQLQNKHPGKDFQPIHIAWDRSALAKAYSSVLLNQVEVLEDFKPGDVLPADKVTPSTFACCEYGELYALVFGESFMKMRLMPQLLCYRFKCMEQTCWMISMSAER
jgi:hypothetical protein